MSYLPTTPYYCTVKGCINISGKRKDGVHYHGFPLNNPDILRYWIEAVGRENWIVTKTSKVCSDHFKDSDYEQLRKGNKRRPLKKNVIPCTVHNQAKKNDATTGEKVAEPSQHNSRQAVRVKSLITCTIGDVLAEEAVDEEGLEVAATSEVIVVPSQHSSAALLEILTCTATEDALAEEAVDEGLKIEESEVEEEGVGEERTIEQEPISYELLYLGDWEKVKLPSTLWGIHRDTSATYIAFTHMNENTTDSFLLTDKAIVISRMLDAELFVRGRAVDVKTRAPQKINTLEDLNTLLQEMDDLAICTGTGLERPGYSPECSLMLDRRCKRYSRCPSCSNKRTTIMKNEAQRMRRKKEASSQRQSEKGDMRYSEGTNRTVKIKLTETEEYLDKQNVEYEEPKKHVAEGYI